MFDDLICFAAAASVSLDGGYEVGCASIVEEEDALADAPEWSGAELIGTGAALGDAVGEAFAHVVDGKVREKIGGLIGERSAGAGGGAARDHFTRGERRGVALGAADFGKCAASAFGGGCRRSG